MIGPQSSLKIRAPLISQAGGQAAILPRRFGFYVRGVVRNSQLRGQARQNDWVGGMPFVQLDENRNP